MSAAAHEEGGEDFVSAAEYPCLGCGIETDETRLFCCRRCFSRRWWPWAPGDPVCVHLDAQALDALRSFYRGEGADLLADEAAARLVLGPAEAAP